MSRRVRVGVVGAGGLGFHHIRLFRDLSGAELVGFHDHGAKRTAQVATELDVRPYPSLEALLPLVDAVSVVVPTSSHHEVARRAIDAGKHVLIEKPIATTVDEADDLLAAAQRAGVLVQVGHVERFNRALRAARPVIDAPLFIEVDRLAPFTPRGADVSVVLDLMIHDLDLMRALLGSTVTELQAVGIQVITPTVDFANARLGFESGAAANLTASRVAKDRYRRMRIFQRTGYISLDLAKGVGAFYRLREELDREVLASAPRAMEDFMDRVPLEAPDAEPLRLEFEAFVAALRGRAPVPVSGEDGREALALAVRVMREIERTAPALSGTAGA